MKFQFFTTILYLTSFFIFTACNNSAKDGKIDSKLVNNEISADGKSNMGSEIDFDKTEHDFGDIMQGEKVEFAFKFQNTGNKDLIITSHSASCGCTVPEYPKGTIAPNKTDFIKVAFDSKGKEGRIHKTVTISTNSNKRDVVLNIKANVIKP